MTKMVAPDTIAGMNFVSNLASNGVQNGGSL
jgi:hypothetical protein